MATDIVKVLDQIEAHANGLASLCRKARVELRRVDASAPSNEAKMQIRKKVMAKVLANHSASIAKSSGLKEQRSFDL